jgi:dolichyl-phosphate-mannose--protein O-mannosyl transferase
MMPAKMVRGVVETVRAVRQDAVDRWGAMQRAPRVTSLLLAFMIVGGVILRIQGIGFPPRDTFDEQFYGPTAHHILLGVPDLHDFHPPLGKLLGAIGLILFGYNSVGWRFMYLCFGLQTIIIGFWLARQIFASRRAAWFAAAFIAADGFFIAHSRTAFIDIMLVCLILWSVLAVVTARTWRGMAIVGILIGIATSIKWSAAQTLVPAVVAVLLYRRVPWYTIFWFGLSPVVHILIWMAGLHLMGHASDPLAVWNVILSSMASLHGLGQYDNPLASAWYTWPALYHPIVVKLSSSGTTSRYASSLGNLVFWFPAVLLVIGLPLARGLTALRTGWRKYWPPFFDASFTKAVLVLATGWAALLTLFVVSMGKHSFFYHYLPPYAFAIILLAGVVAKLERRWPRAVLIFVALSILVALYFVPVWGEFSLTLPEANRRLIFLPWRP